MPQSERRLAAIMFTDIVGYTALTQFDESQAMEVLKRHNQLLRPIFPKFHGKEVKAMGDSFLVEFESALDAVRCAIDIQSRLRDYNISSKEVWKTKLRIGIHLGDVIHRDNDIFGDAVNIASRIEPIAEPEGICVSDQVFGQVRNKVSQKFVRLTPRELKNVLFPIDVYRVVMPWEKEPAILESHEAAKSRRIAILPFANMSPDPNDEYFADGMTEEVISTLSKIRDFEVISRTSVMQYKKIPKPIVEVSRELNAGTILEGSVRKADSRLRITVQLVDAPRDRHLWAESYDRDFKDVFAIQMDIARQVADALSVTILHPEMKRIEKRPTEKTYAYTLYLRGRFLWNKRGGERGIEDVKKAAECFEESVREDPNFALGYVGLADCAVILRDNWELDLEANLAKAKAMVARALELDSGLAEAHATKGFVLKEEYKLREAEEEYKKAIELKPSFATVHQWYYHILRARLRWDEALEQIEKAAELDPLSPVAILNHADYYSARKDYARALELFRRAVAIDPGFANAHWGMAAAYGEMKMYDEMKREAATYVELLRDSYPLIKTAVEAEMARYMGKRKTLRGLMPELEAHSQETLTTAYEIATFHFWLGDTDKGFYWLERAYSKREDSVASYIKWEPCLDGVRDDPRYLDLLKRLGLD